MSENKIACIQCGHCCRGWACIYGGWSEEDEECIFLEDNNCSKYEEILHYERDLNIKSMFGDGCGWFKNDEERDITLQEYKRMDNVFEPEKRWLALIEQEGHFKEDDGWIIIARCNSKEKAIKAAEDRIAEDFLYYREPKTMICEIHDYLNPIVKVELT